MANMTIPPIGGLTNTSTNTEIQLKLREGLGLSVLDQETFLHHIADQTSQSITTLRKAFKELLQAQMKATAEEEGLSSEDNKWYFEFENFWISRYGALIKYVVDWQEWVMWDTFVPEDQAPDNQVPSVDPFSPLSFRHRHKDHWPTSGLVAEQTSHCVGDNLLVVRSATID